jgi:hypothetical protein
VTAETGAYVTVAGLTSPPDGAARPNLSDAESRELEEILTEHGDIFDIKSDNYG